MALIYDDHGKLVWDGEGGGIGMAPAQGGDATFLRHANGKVYQLHGYGGASASGPTIPALDGSGELWNEVTPNDLAMAENSRGGGPGPYLAAMLASGIGASYLAGAGAGAGAEGGTAATAKALPDSYWGMQAAADTGTATSLGGGVAEGAFPATSGGMSTIQTALNPLTGAYEPVGGAMSTTGALQGGTGVGLTSGAGAGTGIGLADAVRAASTANSLNDLTQSPSPVQSGPTNPGGGPAASISPINSGQLIPGISNGALTLGAAGLGVAGAASGILNPTTTQTQSNSVSAMTPEELELIKLNTQLAQKQLANIDQLAPYQQQLIQQAIDQGNQQKQYTDALNAAISPQQYADSAKAQFDYTNSLPAIQQQLLQKQLDALNLNGAATPEQTALIKDATDQAISAGTGDIDTQTKRGIGMIADELANSRGLRLSDTPITREATLLTSRAEDSKASLVRNLRAAQATSQLNYPLAVQQVQNQTSNNQQQIDAAAQQFQAQLQQQAQSNRLALMGQASSTGIGLAGIGGGSSALSALNSSRLANNTTTNSTTPGIGLTQIGQAAGGIGSLISAGSKLEF